MDEKNISDERNFVGEFFLEIFSRIERKIFVKSFLRKNKNFFLRKSALAGFWSEKIKNGVLTRNIIFIAVNFCTAKIQAKYFLHG